MGKVWNDVGRAVAVKVISLLARRGGRGDEARSLREARATAGDGGHGREAIRQHYDVPPNAARRMASSIASRCGGLCLE